MDIHLLVTIGASAIFDIFGKSNQNEAFCFEGRNTRRHHRYEIKLGITKKEGF